MSQRIVIVCCCLSWLFSQKDIWSRHDSTDIIIIWRMCVLWLIMHSIIRLTDMKCLSQNHNTLDWRHGFITQMTTSSFSKMTTNYSTACIILWRQYFHFTFQSKCILHEILFVSLLLLRIIGSYLIFKPFLRPSLHPSNFKLSEL